MNVVTISRMEPHNLAFTPAQSIAEASARMFLLTGDEPRTTRPPKRALLSLARVLGIEVNLDSTNAVVAGEIAESLHLPWREGRHFDGGVVKLSGLNRLLRGAADHLQEVSRAELVPQEHVAEVFRTFPNFRIAHDKYEAINRISDLTDSGPEVLGPGSKEHKSVFTNLAIHVGLEDKVGLSKHALAEVLCQHFGVPWLAVGGSTGQTITLDGLNLVLAGAERYFGVVSAGWQTVGEEATALVTALRAGLEDYYDGRTTVQAMRDAGSRQWRATEWPGFYFEERAIEILTGLYDTPSVGGPRRKYGNTVFDYASSRRVWDLKAHSAAQRYVPSGDKVRQSRGDVLLNDAEAMRDCIGEQGLGFIVLSGEAFYEEDAAFDDWHRAFTQEGQVRPKTRANSDRRRLRKAGFAPLKLDALWIPDHATLLAGFLSGWVSLAKIGRQQIREGQSEGSRRRPKLRMDLHAVDPIRVAETSWASEEGA